ncbi:MAG: hypothetical protein C4334_05315 [Pyrinomonas sp.]|uniref:hypothetical protein n=1 Tax=Pyrinomonas sp. TaxID=2080306 RepID=UPI00331A8AAC
MFNRNRANQEDVLDKVGRALVRAAARAGEADAERVADAPYLFTRVRARIAERQRAKDESGLLFLALFRRTVPLMALATILALMLLWFGNGGVSGAAFNDDLLLGINQSAAERWLFSERRALSNDELLTTILTREDRPGNNR